MRAVGATSKEIRSRIPYVLELVGLAGKENRYPDELSGGEQQRVAVARALVNNPSTIVADEPTGNLDTENSEIVIDLLQKLAHEEGYCVIVVTHDLSIADKADEVLKLKDGCLILE